MIGVRRHRSAIVALYNIRLGTAPARVIVVIVVIDRRFNRHAPPRSGEGKGQSKGERTNRRETVRRYGDS